MFVCFAVWYFKEDNMTNEQILKELEKTIKPYENQIDDFSFTINLTLKNRDYIMINKNTYIGSWSAVCPNTRVI